MPTYNSLGITAALLVTDLDQTLSNDINLRMGKGLQRNTKRIQDQLLNGRALQEQLTVPENSKVGIFQFLGDDEDMVLLVVAASDKQGDDEGIVKDSAMVEGERPENTNAVPTSMTDTTPPHSTPTKNTSGRKKNKRIANNRRASSNGSKRSEKLTESSTTPFDLIAAPAAPAAPSGNTRKRAKSLYSHPAEQLALCLKVDLARFYQKDKADAPLLCGKDLKLEVFINGHLVEVTYETASRPYKRADVIQYSGTRFHRQAEKPWVYVPSAAISSEIVDSTPDQRWDSISDALGQEANMRGTDLWGQCPISAQFLAALARSQLPNSVKPKSQHFAVVDLVITAGKGRKYGSDTTYLLGPTRLADSRFLALAAVSDGLGPLLHQDGDVVLQDDSQMFGGDPMMDFTNFQQSGLTGDMFGLPSEQPRIPATPRTPKTMDMHNAQKLKDILDARPMKKLLSKYENAKGHVKGQRTLRQRFGDMSKMSPRKQLEALSDIREELKEELDDDTMNIIMEAFEHLNPEPAPSESKKVRFSFGEDGVPPAPTFGEQMRYIFGEDAIVPDPTFDENMRSSFGENIMAPAATFDEKMRSSFGENIMAPAATFDETFDTQMIDTAADSLGLTFPQMNSSLLQDDLFGPNAEFDPTTTLNANTDVFHAGATVNPADLNPPASALSGSPTSTRVKYHHSHHMYDPTMDLMDPFADDQQMFALPSVHTPSPVTPQQTIGSSTTKSKKAVARDQLPSNAVKNFHVPELFKGSAVSYADGDKQRQAIKARGGEFEEQQFVVGMRFIVL